MRQLRGAMAKTWQLATGDGDGDGENLTAGIERFGLAGMRP